MSEIFERKEIKYMLNNYQYNEFIKIVKEKMNLDKFGTSTIQSLYFDTIDDKLVKRSIEKPRSKEKLRLRSYNLSNMDDEVFLEIKKKYKGIVYKRRIGIKQKDVNKFLKGEINLSGQIGKELNYFRDFYETLEPRMLLIYDREPYVDNDIRITFDHNIRYRSFDFDFSKGYYGNSITNEDLILMELKIKDAYPFWVIEAFEKLDIKQVSFSKYSTCYQLANKKEIKLREETKIWKKCLEVSLQALAL